MPGRIPTLKPPGRHDARKAYEATDTRAADKRFYASSAWLKLRRFKVARNPLCEPCQASGRTVIADHVHHKLPRKKRPDLALSYDNLESVCQPCHNAKGVGHGDR